jgi:hypothetical protein
MVIPRSSDSGTPEGRLHRRQSTRTSRWAITQFREETKFDLIKRDLELLERGKLSRNVWMAARPFTAGWFGRLSTASLR